MHTAYEGCVTAPNLEAHYDKFTQGRPRYALEVSHCQLTCRVTYRDLQYTRLYTVRMRGWLSGLGRMRRVWVQAQ